ncbi:MAG: hypothetical protein ABH846_04475 [Patescibacteria group bacterium]
MVAAANLLKRNKPSSAKQEGDIQVAAASVETQPQMTVEVTPEAAPASEQREVAPEAAQEMITAEENQEIVPKEVSEAPKAVSPAAVPTQKDPILEGLENILADDLADIYIKLPENKRPAFKAKGEEIAILINEMILTGKIKAKKILDYIRDWLRMVPGINKFFLEQAAKIKADRIMEYIHEKQESSDDKI